MKEEVTVGHVKPSVALIKRGQTPLVLDGPLFRKLKRHTLEGRLTYKFDELVLIELEINLC